MKSDIVVDQPMQFASALTRGSIAAVHDAYHFVVHVRQASGERLVDADLVVASNAAPDLRLGDCVLCCVDSDDPDRVLVLGRIGSGAAPLELDPSGSPDELVIEARKSLTLRVGDGSITIREDGRILIKGRELVSHAKGMNRIRGGAVTIN
ncbi:MAG TPA: hypothetical protein VFH27_05605 [Longimicrobiaceae bacterium]|nr:hypothetical protein [Longimicrobiaceae bacterium]